MKIIFSVLLILSACIGGLYAANPQVTLQISGAVTGNIVLELYADKAPVTTANFINYVQSNFYKGLIFHRVMSGFMIQGGGFDQNVVQKTAGLLPAIINESRTGLSNLRGTIAMARTTAADSATSQFFINQVNNTFLDYGYVSGSSAVVGYTAFGKVIAGMSVVDAIAVLPTSTQNGMTDVPVNDVIIQNATITLNSPVCAEKLQGDIDGNCSVNFADFAKMAENWLECNSVTTSCN